MSLVPTHKSCGCPMDTFCIHGHPDTDRYELETIGRGMLMKSVGIPKHPFVPKSQFFKRLKISPYEGEWEFSIGPQMPSIIINGACPGERKLIGLVSYSEWICDLKRLEGRSILYGFSTDRIFKIAQSWLYWGNCL